MTVEVILIALLAGLAGGAVAAVVLGAIQARMAGGSGSSRFYTFARHAPGFEHSTPMPGAGMVSRRVMVRLDQLSGTGKRVLALAEDEATRHNHNYIGTEHLLSALLRDGDTIAARALVSLGVDLTKVRTAVEFIVGRGDQTTSPSEITLSPRTKKVIDLAIAEAGQMGQPYVGPEHVLLGVIDEGEGIASGILESLGVQLATVRVKVLELLNESGSPAPAGYTPSTLRPHHPGPFDRFSSRAKRALALAQEEAMRMGHNYIGPEHLLLGLARMSGMGVADQAMKRIFDELGLTVESLRAELAEVIPLVEQRTPQWEVVLSPETKQIFQLVIQEPDANTVLPEHFLVAIVRDEQSFAVQILSRLGVTPERVRAAVGH